MQIGDLEYSSDEEMYSDMEDLEPPPRRGVLHGRALDDEARGHGPGAMGGFPGAGQGRRVIYHDLNEH